MAEDYDIAGAIKRIEDELIASMIRNLDRHRAEEDDLGINWEQWQVKQFAALEEYRKRNLKQYADKFNDINKRIAGLITLQREAGNADQEIAILEALRKGARLYRTGIGISGEFFRMNDRKMDALIRATTNDMQKAEYAMLRMSNDRYRQVIFNAQMYAASGSGTYEKAVDMATKDFLRAGINCVEYKNGARHTLSDYADMAIRTASKRAYLTGEGEKRMEWGVSTVIMNKRGNPCPKCLPFVGKVLIDDVWSGGSRKDGKYPLMSSAIAAGLYHPRCKDGHTTYFPGISDMPDDKFTKKELQTIEEQNRAEAEQQYAGRQAESFDRLARYSLDNDNKRRYEIRRDEWRNVHFKTNNLTYAGYTESKRSLSNFHALPHDQVVNISRKDSEEWVKLLSDKQIMLIRKYTYNSGDKKPNRFFERLNAMLRGDIAEDKKLREYADIISEALGKNKMRHDLLCYRNIEFNPYANYEVGKVFVEEQFISTSIVESAALNKSFKMIFLVPKGSRGAYIESISKYPEQREFLLDKKCKLRIVSKQKDNILVEVIP